MSTECTYSGQVLIDRCRFEGEVIHTASRFDAPVAFERCVFDGSVLLNVSDFRSQVNLLGCRFAGDVDLHESVFASGAYFDNSEFNLRAGFDRCSFAWEVSFAGAKILNGASFGDCTIGGALSFVAGTIRNYMLLPPAHWGDRPWWLKVRHWFTRRQPISLAFVRDTDVAHCTSTHFRRWVMDRNFLEDLRRSHPALYWAWMLASDCGRSFSLWLVWALVVAVLFGALFSAYPPWPWLPETLQEWLCNLGCEVQVSSVENAFTPYYFSLVTLTTLGFGDVVPLNVAGQVAICVEVVVGYLALGGLVAILAQKLARRA